MTDSNASRRADDDRFAWLLMEHLAGQLDGVESDEFWQMVAAQPRRVRELMSLTWQATAIQSRLKPELLAPEAAAASLPRSLFPSLDLESENVFAPPAQASPAGVSLGDESQRLTARRRVMVMFSIFFAGLTLTSLLLTTAQIPFTKARPPAVSTTAEAPPAVAARIVGAWNCTWEGSSPADSTLAGQDSLALRSGLVELRFADGANVLLEGPARFRIDSASGGSLQVGALTAIVPPRGRGFSIATPHLQITDLGTEFAVHASAAGIVEVHVFSGQVETQLFKPTGDDRPQRLHASQSLRYDSTQQTTQLLPADSSRLVRSHFKPSSSQQLAISPEYVAAVLRSQPLGYWRFEELGDDLRVEDEIGNHPLESRGLVELSGASSNRWLKLPSGAALVADDALAELRQGEYSIELWFRATETQAADLVSILSEISPGEWKHGVYLTAWANGRNEKLPIKIRVLHRWPPGHDRRTGTNLYHRVPRDKWQHLVLVKRPADLQIFSQGEFIAKSPDNTQFDGERLRLLIGNLQPRDHSLSDYVEIDELAIYSRSLSVNEIAEHFSAAQPLVPAAAHLNP